MAKVVKNEFIEVTAQFDDEPRRTVVPRTILCEYWSEASDAIERALALGCTVIVQKQTYSVDDECCGPEDPALDNWPALKHVRTQT